MSLGATLARLRHGWSLEEAAERIADAVRHGLVYYTDLATQSTRVRAVCPRCLSGVTVGPVLHRCAAGCGWTRVARVDVGGAA